MLIEVYSRNNSTTFLHFGPWNSHRQLENKLIGSLDSEGQGFFFFFKNIYPSGQMWYKKPTYSLTIVSSLLCNSHMQLNVLHSFFTDNDECVSGVHDCHRFASCTNTLGSFNCSCNQSYVGNGTHCWQPSGKYVTLISLHFN